MNIRDCQQIYHNLLYAMLQKGHERPDAAYAWTRLLCRRLRSLTVKRVEEAYDWL